jgi:hypothetical protein
VTDTDSVGQEIFVRRVHYPGNLQISFVHVIGNNVHGTNSMGSIRIGNIGGSDSGEPGYLHTHIVFFRNGVTIDPRSEYCKEFGF